MNRPFALVIAILLLASASAWAGEIIIWYDDQGVAHKAASPDDIPAKHRPQAQGIQTSVTPTVIAEAETAGARLAADPVVYREGLGLFHEFGFELDMENVTGYFFVGTKYNMLKAAGAAAGQPGKVPPEFVRKVTDMDTLPVGFYSPMFTPVLMMMTQDGTFIRGEEGFPKDADPKLSVPAFVMTFPYEAIDFARPVQVQLYDRDGRVIQLVVDLPSLR